MTFFVTLSQPVSECHRISIWRVTVSRIETSLSKCRTSFLKTIEHTLQQQNIISVLNSDAPGISFLSKISRSVSSKKNYINSCPLFGYPVRVTDVLYVEVQVNIHIRREMFLVGDGFQTWLLSG